MHPNDVLVVAAELQKEGTFKLDKDRRDSTTSSECGDTLTRRNTEINSKNNISSMNMGLSTRRKTIKDMKKNYTKNKGKLKVFRIFLFILVMCW